MEPNETTYFVRLDNERLPLMDAEKLHYTGLIAEALLRLCGLISIREEQSGHTVFRVRKFPDNVPQADIYWINAEDTVEVFHGSPFEK